MHIAENLLGAGKNWNGVMPRNIFQVVVDSTKIGNDVRSYFYAVHELFVEQLYIFFANRPPHQSDTLVENPHLRCIPTLGLCDTEPTMAMASPSRHDHQCNISVRCGIFLYSKIYNPFPSLLFNCGIFICNAHQLPTI